MKDFKETFIKVEADVRASIEIIHKSGHRIGLVVDKKSKLLGTVTDGDIRRALLNKICLLYTSPSPRDLSTSRMPSSA